MRPADVPGPAIDQADYVLIAEMVEVDRWDTGGDGWAAHHASVGHPRRRERLHDRHLPADHRPPPRPVAEFLHDYRAAFVR
jgi:hypothetical protein